MRLPSSLVLVLVSCAMPAQLRSRIPGGVPAAPQVTQVAAGAAVKVVGTCTPERNHCVRDDTWFWIEAAYPGSAGIAIPVYQKKDGRWFSYGGERKLGGWVLHTAVAVPEKTKPRDVLIVWRPNDDEPTWPISEEVAQSQSRWVVMVVDAVDPSARTFNIKAREDMRIDLAASRRVLERKELPATKQADEPDDDR